MRNRSFLFHVKYMSIQPNQWLSTFFQRKIGEIEKVCDIECHQLSQYDLVQSKLSSLAQQEIDYIQSLGFTLVEGEIIFEYDLANFSPNLTACRVATEQDFAQLEPFSHLFSQTRFRSPWFSSLENRRFYWQWIQNAVKGEFDDLCLLSETVNGEIQGMITVRVKENTAQVGLLAVAEKWQKQGIGYRLLMDAIAWAKSQQETKMVISTQLSNLAAIQLYQRLNGKISGTYYWFYR